MNKKTGLKIHNPGQSKKYLCPIVKFFVFFLLKINMKQEVEITNSVFFEFQRYIRGEMSKREETTFQKNLRKDLYAEPAIEGFPEVSDEKPAEDIYASFRMDEKESNKARRGKKILSYGIAASVVALMLITSAYLIVEKKIPVGQLNIGTHSRAILPAVTDPDQIASFLTAESMNKIAIPDIRDVPPPPVAIADTANLIVASDPLMTGGAELTSMNQLKDSGSAVATDQMAAIAGAPAARTNETVPPAETSKAGYVSPEPVTGYNNLNKYIEENIRKPGTLSEGENAVAVVSFVVRSTGTIDSIKVLSSPGDEYTAEAIRLIKEGPAWKPAENNGQIIDDKASIRIVFK